VISRLINKCGSRRVRYKAWAAVIFVREFWQTKVLRRESQHVLRWQFEAAYRAHGFVSRAPRFLPSMAAQFSYWEAAPKITYRRAK